MSLFISILCSLFVTTGHVDMMLVNPSDTIHTFYVNGSRAFELDPPTSSIVAEVDGIVGKTITGYEIVIKDGRKSVNVEHHIATEDGKKMRSASGADVHYKGSILFVVNNKERSFDRDAHLYFDWSKFIGKTIDQWRYAPNFSPNNNGVMCHIMTKDYAGTIREISREEFLAMGSIDETYIDHGKVITVSDYLEIHTVADNEIRRRWTSETTAREILTDEDSDRWVNPVYMLDDNLIPEEDFLKMRVKDFYSLHVIAAGKPSAVSASGNDNTPLVKARSIDNPMPKAPVDPIRAYWEN